LDATSSLPWFGASGNEVGITFATAAFAPSSIRLAASRMSVGLDLTALIDTRQVVE
jgi:hypothetical protein